MGSPSLQEIFDTAVSRVLAQGAKCEGPVPGGAFGKSYCRYRNDVGQCCVVGGLIPDELYMPGIESGELSMIDAENDGVIPFEQLSGGESPRVILHSTLAKLGIADSDSIHLLTKLQRVHDNHPVAEWRREFAAIAKSFKLNNQVCL